MTIANVIAEWSGGNLVFKNAITGATLLTMSATTGIVPYVPFTAGANLTAGELIYISGWDATGGRVAMNKADADAANPAKCAQFVCAATVSQGAEGSAVSQYTLTGQNTNAATVGDPVYLGTTAGGWSLSAAGGAGSNVQQVGVVSVKSATVGEIVFNTLYSKCQTALS